MVRTPRGTATHNMDPQSIPVDAPRDTAMIEFANRIQKAMVEKGWSQSELGRRASENLGKDIGRDSISQYIRGKALPNAERLAALAHVLGKKPSDLLPTRGIKSAADSNPAVDIRETADGNAWLRINQQVPWEKAVQILKILKDEAA